MFQIFPVSDFGVLKTEESNNGIKSLIRRHHMLMGLHPKMKEEGARRRWGGGGGVCFFGNIPDGGN